MNVNLLFFGETADALKRKELAFELGSGSRVGDAVELLTARFPNLQNHKLLFAVNQEYATADHAIKDGDELAIFTAVSGG